MTDISIVIVSWNTKAVLLDCLRSIFDGNAECSLEVMVVDNGSSDGSPEAVRQQFPQVQVIETGANLGFAKANNIGIRTAAGRYICLINSDVIVSPGCLHHLMCYMETNSAVGMVAPKILNMDRTLQLSCRCFPSLWSSFCRALALDTMFPNLPLFSRSHMQYWDHNEPRKVEVLSGCFWMLRRKAVEIVGLLDEQFFMYSEDVDYCKRFWKNRWEIAYLPEVNSIHLGGASSSHRPVRYQVEGIKARQQYWRKHHSRLGQLAYRIISLVHELRRTIQSVVLYALRGSRRREVVTDLHASIACLRWLFHPSQHDQTS